MPDVAARLVEDSATNRRRLAAHATPLRGAFPVDGRGMRRLLSKPGGAIAASSAVNRTVYGDVPRIGRQLGVWRGGFGYVPLGMDVTLKNGYSRRSRSCTISRCNSPRNPQRNPNPSATELSDE